MSKTVITLEQLKRTAKLARLELTEAQEKKFLPQLESILEYFDVLNKAKTDGVEPTYQVTGLKNVFHDDVIDTSRMFTQEQALSNAPKKQDGYFVTAATIKKWTY